MSNENRRTSSYVLVLAALCTALIIVGSYISIPFVPVPLVLANFFALLAGLLCGPVWGSVSVILYLILGAFGLPVFAGAAGGFAHFASPTGGFLLGYLLAAFVAGLIANPRRGRRGIIRLLVASLAGMVALYAIGLPWLQISLAGKFHTLWAATVYMAPFMLGDLLKVVVASLVARAALPAFRVRES